MHARARQELHCINTLLPACSQLFVKTDSGKAIDSHVEGIHLLPRKFQQAETSSKKALELTGKDRLVAEISSALGRPNQAKEQQ
jgi:hypothetical protein